MRDPGETATMEQLGPAVLLAFALVGLALIILAVSVVRKLRRPGGPQEQTLPTSAPIPQPISQLKSMTSATAAPAAQPALHKAPPANAPAAPSAPQSQPVGSARQPSYTEIAAAAGGPRSSAAPACTRTRVDYANEATEVGTAPSYTALAVANAARAARNMPPLSTVAPTIAPATSAAPAPAAQTNDNAAPARSNGSGQSYAAVALATVGEFTPKRAAPASAARIDYAGTLAEVAAGASYTAIAVAAAARNS